MNSFLNVFLPNYLSFLEKWKINIQMEITISFCLHMYLYCPAKPKRRILRFFKNEITDPNECLVSPTSLYQVKLTYIKKPCLNSRYMKSSNSLLSQNTEQNRRNSMILSKNYIPHIGNKNTTPKSRSESLIL